MIIPEAKDPLQIWLAEAGVAAACLLEECDPIPDDGIGLADDALIVERVMHRNRTEIYHSWNDLLTTGRRKKGFGVRHEVGRNNPRN